MCRIKNLLFLIIPLLSFAQEEDRSKASKKFFDKYDISEKKLVYYTDEGAINEEKPEVDLSSIAYFTKKDKIIPCKDLSDSKKSGFQCDIENFKWKKILKSLEEKGVKNPFYEVFFRKTLDGKAVNIDHNGYNAYILYFPKADTFVNYDKYFDALSKLEEAHNYKYRIIYMTFCE